MEALDSVDRIVLLSISFPAFNFPSVIYVHTDKTKMGVYSLLLIKLFFQLI